MATAKVERRRKGVSFEAALDALRAAGFRNSDVSAILPERDRTTKDLAHEINTKAPEVRRLAPEPGRPWVAYSGGSWASGHWPFPESGLSLQRGPSSRAGRRGGRVATGGLVGGLIGAGIPEVEAKQYAGRIREGGYLVSVHCDDREWARSAKEILEATSGRDVVSTSESAPDYRP